MGGIGEIVAEAIKPAFDLIDNLTTTKEEKLQLKNTLLKTQNDLIETTNHDKKEVMLAELNQDDKYTKRARPTLVYAGLAIVFINYAILPWMAWFSMFFAGKEILLPSINFPSEFWIAWGGAVGVYAFRRTSEKLGNKNGRQ